MNIDQQQLNQTGISLDELDKSGKLKSGCVVRAVVHQSSIFKGSFFMVGPAVDSSTYFLAEYQSDGHLQPFSIYQHHGSRLWDNEVYRPIKVHQLLAKKSKTPCQCETCQRWSTY